MGLEKAARTRLSSSAIESTADPAWNAGRVSTKTGFPSEAEGEGVTADRTRSAKDLLVCQALHSGNLVITILHCTGFKYMLKLEVGISRRNFDKVV